MTTFNLYERPDGRVVINANEEPKSTLLRTIEAANWKAARATINEDEFFYDPGHGYFITPLPGAYQRQKAYHERIANAILRERMMVASLADVAIRPKRNKKEALEV